MIQQRLQHTAWDRFGTILQVRHGWVTVRLDGEKGVRCYEVDAPYIKIIK